MMRAAGRTIRIGPPRPGADAGIDATVLARLAALKSMSVNELKAEWRSLFGSDAPNNSRPFLCVSACKIGSSANLVVGSHWRIRMRI
jgi:hypothetical protein